MNVTALLQMESRLARSEKERMAVAGDQALTFTAFLSIVIRLAAVTAARHR